MQQKTVDKFIIFAKATFNISLYCYKNVSMLNFEMLAMQNAYIQKNEKKEENADIPVYESKIHIRFD